MGAFRRWVQDTTIHGALIQAVLPLLLVALTGYFGYGYLVGHGSKEAGTGKASPDSALQGLTARSPYSGPPPLVIDRSLKQGENARASFRESFALRALVPEENDLPISSVPRGVYGSADIRDVREFVNARPPAERNEFRLRRGRIDDFGGIEVHKLQDRSIRLLGFVSRDVALQLDADARKSPRVTLYNTAWPNADYLVSLRVTEVKIVRDVRLITYEGGIARALDLELDVPPAP